MMKCKFCDREFKREASIANHLCEQKRRWQQKDEHVVKLAFLSWLKFMENIRTAKKSKYEYEDFMKSRLYNQFVKFSRHMQQLNAVKPEKYLDYLLKHNIKITEWVKDYPYESYMAELSAKEDPADAIARSLIIADKWADEKKKPVTEFFESVNTNTFTYWIMTGKISPWFLFCSKNASKLFERLNEEQVGIIDKYIDRAKWKVKINKNKEEFDRLSNILKESGI